MASIGIASSGPAALQSFPFVDSPDTRNINDGVRLLEELGAVDPDPDHDHTWLTDLGRRLARLPVDPRIARMVIAADEFNQLDSVLVIAAAMSIQDPREDPREEREMARRSHSRFMHESSDMMSLLRLWDYVNVERRNAVLERVPTHVSSRVPAPQSDPGMAGPLRPAQAGESRFGIGRTDPPTGHRGRCRRRPPGTPDRSAQPDRYEGRARSTPVDR